MFKSFKILLIFIFIFATCAIAQEPATQPASKSIIDKILSFDFIGCFIAVSAILSAIGSFFIWLGKYIVPMNKVGSIFGTIVLWIGKIINLLNSFHGGTVTDKNKV